MAGDPCHMNKGLEGVGCDGDVGLKCGEEFSTSTFQFSGKAVCIDSKDCGQPVTGGANTTHLCYAEPPKAAQCGNGTACALPDGADAKLKLACANISSADKKTAVTQMCVDSDTYCTGDGDLTIEYFGTKLPLVCAAVRNVLAMGAGALSWYYAM